MTVRYGVLHSKFGHLCHGPIESVQKELDEKWKDFDRKEYGLFIEKYDHCTHYLFHDDVQKKSYLKEREEELKVYSAKDLYKATPLRIDNHFWEWSDLVTRELNYCSNEITDIEIRILFDDQTHQLATFWFEGIPFMIGQSHCYDDERNEIERFITNTEVFWKVIEHLNRLSREEPQGVINETEIRAELTDFGYVSFNLKK